jgi:hypothetical protein
MKLPQPYYTFWSAIVLLTLLSNAAALWWISGLCGCAR